MPKLIIIIQTTRHGLTNLPKQKLQIFGMIESLPILFRRIFFFQSSKSDREKETEKY